MTKTSEIQAIGIGSTVHFEHDGRIVSGRVRSTMEVGATLVEVVVFSADLGHTHRIDHGVRVKVGDLRPAPVEVPTVDIAELTRMFGEPADQQYAVAAWTGEDNIWVRGTDGLEPQPRWTPAEAAELLRVWRLDAERIASER